MKERAVGGTRNTRSRVLSVYPSPQDVVLFLSVRRERVIFLATRMKSSSRPSLTHSSRSLFSLTTLLAHSSRSLLSFHSYRSTQGQVRFGDRSTFRFDGVVMPDSTQTSVFGAVGQGAVQEVRTVVGGAVEVVEVVVVGAWC